MLVEDLTKLRDGIRFLKYGDLRAAIRGESVPEEFPHDLTTKCLVAGIRHHDGFAQDLRRKTLHPSVKRALNARDIMSNRVPTMDRPESIPYCFWHPDVPNEDTLRQLLRDYPTPLMRYQVGRACAAGGYTELYKELDLLPDVAIAEEARDNLSHSKEIYNMVMIAPVRYHAMDDYNHCLIDNPTPGAFLNADTCVRSTLSKRQPVNPHLFPPPLDITEDWCLGAEGTRLEELPIPDDVIFLFYNPLPLDLPVMNKDILILLAAFHGNIDRYVRLRRPRMVNGEMQCIVRGILHDTFFAKWCYQQPHLKVLRKFVYARWIMNDDLTWINQDVPILDKDLPDMIWHPRKAYTATYEELARLVPSMREAAVHALIVCDDCQAFLRLEPEATCPLYQQIVGTNRGRYNKEFDDFFKERVSEDELNLWEEDTELTWNVHDVAPYEHLVSKEMLDVCPAGRGEITLDDVGFENREVYVPDKRDARDIMRFISAYPRTSRQMEWEIASTWQTRPFHLLHLSLHFISQNPTPTSTPTTPLLAIMDRLLSRQAASGEPLLVLAARRNRTNLFKEVLEMPEERIGLNDSMTGHEALSIAIQNGKNEIVTALVSLPPSVFDFSRNPAMEAGAVGHLNQAADLGRLSIFKILVDTGRVDINQRDARGRSPLCHAARSGSTEIVELLLGDENVEKDEFDEDGRTPLSHAAELGHIDIVRLLLRCGKVNAGSKDLKGNGPYYYAIRFHHERIGQDLLATGRVNTYDGLKAWEENNGDPETDINMTRQFFGHANL
ncbi:hypothetical protein FSARC_495 [Fusarium sarcochroum]|uniref:Ankyrin n=1 Tax=Fusarium sarcochroum TaxID=1208366 RepID=A0A8H4UBC3_9HYPO|nr:hypothetical protein FSARC_495 [Fusarium sarcochroum]